MTLEELAAAAEAAQQKTGARTACAAGGAVNFLIKWDGTIIESSGPGALVEAHINGETRMSLEELAVKAEAAQEKAWAANNAAWAAWQAAQNLADAARALVTKAKEKQE